MNLEELIDGGITRYIFSAKLARRLVKIFQHFLLCILGVGQL